MCLTIRSVARRRDAERALQSIASELSRTQKIAQLGTWSWDLRTGAHQWSDQYFRILGYETTRVEASYEVLINHIHPDDRDRVARTIFDAIQDLSSFATEYRIVRDDGAIAWIYAQGEVVRDGAGAPHRMFGTALDITARKVAEQNIENSQSMLRLVLDAIPVRIFWKSRELTYLGCNRKFCEDTGLSCPSQIVGLSDGELMWPEQSETELTDDRTVIDSGTPMLHIEERQSPTTGARRWLRTSKIPLPGPDGDVLGLLGCYEDITKQKSIEEKLRLGDRILKESPHTVALIGTDHVFKHVSNSLLLAHGVSEREIIGHHVSEFFGQGAFDTSLLPHLDGCLSGQEFRFEAWWEYRKLGWRYMSVVLSPLRRGDSAIDGVIIFAHDLTDRRLSEDALRSLHDISTSQNLPFHEKLDEFLNIGRRLLKMPNGIVSRINGKDYTIIACQTSDGSIRVGKQLNLDDMYCGDVIAGAEVVSFEHAKTSNWSKHPCYQSRRIESYIGVPIEVSGTVFGTLHFFNSDPRTLEFSSTDRDIVRLMAAWIGADIARQQAEEELVHEKERAQITLHSIGDAVITTSPEGMVEYLNPVAEALTGCSHAEACGRPIQTVYRIIHERTRKPARNPVSRCLRQNKVVEPTQPMLLVGRDGREHAIEDTASPIRGHDGEILGAVLVFHDVTELRRLAHKLAHDAAHDPLTGLVNRREFEQRLDRTLGNAKRLGAQHALCYMDLDQFKLINDVAGHAAGDEYLKQITAVLSNVFRKRDTFARLGGDEFGLLLDNCGLEEAKRIGEVVLATIRDFRFVWKGRIFRTGISIGIVAVTADCDSAAELLSRADVACYAAKENGRNRIHVYVGTGTQPSEHHSQILLAANLRDILEAGRLSLYCQPIVALKPGIDNTPRCEMLVRLHGDNDEIIVPSAFIPAAERYGMMAAVDRWVVTNALKLIAQQYDPADPFTININLSASSVTDPNFVDFFERGLAENGVDARHICIEITETAVLKSLGMAEQFVRDIKTVGVSVALDDFGSGFSNLSYLKQIPADFLKIDGSFVRDVAQTGPDREIVRTISALGHTFGMQTVAEYVHDQDVLEVIRGLGVDYAQGYALGEPAPAPCLHLFSHSGCA